MSYLYNSWLKVFGSASLEEIEEQLKELYRRNADTQQCIRALEVLKAKKN